jgi:hypothetical protein
MARLLGSSAEIARGFRGGLAGLELPGGLWVCLASSNAILAMLFSRSKAEFALFWH